MEANMKPQRNLGARVAVVLLATAAVGMARTTTMPVPGTVNYVEGQVALNGQNLSAKSPGSALLETNQVLDTGQGKAELLLTPGVFLRMGDNSEVRMVSPGLADTRVELVKGTAMLEVAELFKENDLSVMVDGSTTRIEKNGLYDFQTQPAAVSVLDGKATVSDGTAYVTLKKGHEVLVTDGQPLKSQSLNKEAVEGDPLYRWSKLRSEYEAEANVDTARMVVVNGGWYGAGWYWDPFWSFYAFLPGDGMLYSPFGFGFYSPGLVWRAPYYRYRATGRNGLGAAPRVAQHFSASPHVMPAPMGGLRGGMGRR
jgi:FecR protein